MPNIKELTQAITDFAPTMYQESYDNAQLITGQASWNCTGALLTLDVLPEVVDEAIAKKCNLIVAHHPIVFKGLKSITGKNYVEKTVLKAIKNDIAIFAAHTNIDNVQQGVNFKIASKLQLTNCSILDPKPQVLNQLTTYVPISHLEQVRNAMFEAGAGHIGNYEQCSFTVSGMGTYKGNVDSNPTIGEPLKLQREEEIKIEVLVPAPNVTAVLSALFQSHPYEEVAYYLIPILNKNQDVGSGMIGELEREQSEVDFMNNVKEKLQVQLIRHTKLLGRPIRRVALCGGAGSFLLKQAKKQAADVFISADFKYHEFFDAENQIVILDIGHYESEQFTPELFHEIIVKKFPNFAVYFSEVHTNPINYF